MTSNTLLGRISIGLLATVSAAGLSASASAQKVLFSDDPALSGATLTAGQEITTTGGTTQIMTNSGAIVSLVGGGSLRVQGDQVTVQSGSVTVAAPAGSQASIVLPGGASATLSGSSPSGTFTVNGSSFTGTTLAGTVTIDDARGSQAFKTGAAWEGTAGGSTSRVFANAAAPAPAAGDAVQPASDVAQAAANGVPVNLGEALAAVGASGDVVQAARNVQAAATNPAIPGFPAGDVAILVAEAARLQTAFGGQLFAGAEPGIIQAYLGYLADGGAGDQFKAAYATFINQYIDLLRTGAAPSGFTGASQEAVNAYLTYLSTTGALQQLSDQNQALAEAYLDFLSTGGGAADFTKSYTDLITAYLDFLKTGGVPSQFTGATQETIKAYFAFLESSGLADAIPQASKAIFEAYAQYLANGGTGVFVPPGGSNPTNPTNPGGPLPEYASILQAYLDFIKGGGNPNGYAGLTIDLLKQYINLAIEAGLFAGVPESSITLIRQAIDLLAATGTLDQLAAILSGITLTLPNVPTTPTNPTNPGTPGAGNQLVAYAGDGLGIDGRADATTTINDAAGLTKYAWTEDESPEIGSNTAYEAGGVAGVIGWTRWAGGSTAGRFYNMNVVSRTAKQGVHLVYGTPATNLPTSGTATYALIGSTKPTISDGSLDPGSVSGSAAVAFGSTPKVGIDLDVSIGGFTYAVETTGGVANPGQSQMSVGSNMAFSGYGVSIPSGGAVCGGGSCQVDMQGFLAGTGASHLGLSYMISASGNGGGLTVTGAAAFAK